MCGKMEWTYQDHTDESESVSSARQYGKENCADAAFGQKNI
jgi:hypothetical protein